MQAARAQSGLRPDRNLPGGRSAHGSSPDRGRLRYQVELHVVRTRNKLDLYSDKDGLLLLFQGSGWLLCDTAECNVEDTRNNLELQLRILVSYSNLYIYIYAFI